MAKSLVQQHFKSEDEGGVIGNVITDNDEALILPFIVAPVGATGTSNGVVKAGTCNVAYRKSILLEIGGFDEAFDPKWRGDSDLCLRVLEIGLKIVHEPTAIVYHPVRKNSLRDIWKDGFKRYHDVLLYSKHNKNSIVNHHLGDGFTKPFGRFSLLSIFIFFAGFLVCLHSFTKLTISFLFHYNFLYCLASLLCFLWI